VPSPTSSSRSRGTRIPGEPVIRRHVWVDPIPATAWATAVFAGYTPEESRTDEQQAALALAATLTDELITADALLFAAPLHNFGVSQPFKTWVDMIITDQRMAAGTQPTWSASLNPLRRLAR
jgi:FMN-dependent NADH-azoreductase